MLESLINTLCKIGTFLNFSFNKKNSPNIKTNAKTKTGNVAATSGNNSPLYIVHNYYEKKEVRETISYTKSWQALLKVFSPEFAQRIARMINDPKSKDAGKHNLNGHKTWISQQFENIGLDHSDPRATIFNRIREESITSIEELYDHGQQSQFEKAWANHLFDLETIKDV